MYSGVCVITAWQVGNDTLLWHEQLHANQDPSHTTKRSLPYSWQENTRIIVIVDKVAICSAAAGTMLR